MNLEPVIQNEVNQKEKNKYPIYQRIYTESRKMVLMNLFAGQKYRDIEKRFVDTGGERKGGTN